MIVTEEQVSEAVQYLSDTDGEEARLYGYYESMKDLLKPVYGECFNSTTGAQESRKAAAYADDMYKAQLERMDRARVEYWDMKNRRNTKALIISVWQSENANRRAGVIL